MVCVEPGASLVALAQKRLEAYQQISFDVSTFEDWSADDQRFDLVLSAQAFHWIPTSIAYEKSARILKPSGCLALVWNMHPDASGPLWETMQRIYADLWPSGYDETIPYQEMAELRAKEISESGDFDPPQVGIFPWSETYTTERYLGLLSTNSNHISLQPELRHRLFSAIAGLIDSYGGKIERPYLAYAYVAQVRN
jgi:SAM-dependent methyltransferase